MVSANQSLPNLSDSRAPPSPSTSHPSSSQSSLGSLGRRSQPPTQPEGFSVFVTDISGSRPVSGHSDSFARNAHIKKLVAKRESTTLKARSDGVDESKESSQKFRVFTQKPSMIHLPGGGSSKSAEKARRVRLFVPKEQGSAGQLAIYSEDDYLLQVVDLTALRSTDISQADPSLFHLPHTLLINHRTTPGSLTSVPSPNHRHSSRPPPSPSSPSFAGAGQGPDAFHGLNRNNSYSSHHLVNSSPKSPRSSPGRPSTSSAAYGSGSGSSYHLMPGPHFSPTSSPGFGDASSSSATLEHLYLRFPSSETCRTWLALLRSFTILPVHTTPPQTSATSSSAASPSWQVALEPTYRTRTKLSLRICEARFASSSSTHLASSSASIISQDDSSLPSTFVEIQTVPIRGSRRSSGTAGGRMLARTSVSRGEAKPKWDQNFVFEDLEGEGKEEIKLVVWKERKMGREGLVGSCAVGGKGVMREGETLEGWYPLLDGSQYAGELKVRVTFTEQIIFSRAYYRDLELSLSDPIRNVLPVWKESDQEVVARSLMRNALINGTSEQLMQSLVEAEDLSSDTIFRSSTILTKCLEVFMKDHLQPFLSSALFRTITYICSNNIALDIKFDRPEALGRPLKKDDLDFARKEYERTERRRKKVAADGRALMGLVESVWADIYSSRGMLPGFVRNVFGVLFNAVKNEDKFKAITSILFLRLLVPGMMYPSLFGLTSALPDPAVHHTLKLVAKSLSGLSFGGLLESKEPEMHALMDAFAKSRHEQVTDFLYFVCRQEPAAVKEASQETGNSSVISFLSSQPPRDGQAVPPHFLDPAADLASLCTAISKSIDTMITLGSIPSNFESSPSFSRQYPIVAITARIVDDEAEVRRLKLNQESSERLRISPFGSNANPSPQYILSNSPPRQAKRPSRDRSQTVSGSVSINGSSSLFGSAYSLSNSNSSTKEERFDSFEDLPTPLPSRSIGRRGTELPAFNQGRRPSLPTSMSTYPNPFSSKSNSTRPDPESEDEREEQSSRLLFFAAQRAEPPQFAVVNDQPSLSAPMTGSKSSERVSTPEDPLASSSKKKFKWNAAFGGGKTKTQV